MPEEFFDIRSLPFAEAIAYLRAHGDPADARSVIDAESLAQRFPALASVEPLDLEITTPSASHKARCYRDPHADNSGRALVWVHGGAFVGGSVDMPEANWVAMELAHQGIPVLAVDYAKCLGETHYPVPNDDVMAAWEYAIDHATELFAVSADDMFLGGASAGGALTASAVTRLLDAQDQPPKGLVLVYPVLHPDGHRPGVVPGPTDHGVEISLNYAGSEELFNQPQVFAGMGSGLGFPPTLIVVCEHDDLRPSGEAFATTFAAAGVDVRLRLEVGAHHGHLNEPSDPAAELTLEEIAQWITMR